MEARPVQASYVVLACMLVVILVGSYGIMNPAIFGHPYPTGPTFLGVSDEGIFFSAIFAATSIAAVALAWSNRAEITKMKAPSANAQIVGSVVSIGVTVALAIISYELGNGTTIAICVGALGGIVHEIGNSGGKYLLPTTANNQVELGGLFGLLEGGVAGLILAQGLSTLTPSASLLGQSFLAGLAIKGFSDAVAGQTTQNTQASLTSSGSPLLATPQYMTLTADPSPNIGYDQAWSVTGATPGAEIQYGYMPVGVKPAPEGAGFLVVQTATADVNGNAGGSIPISLAGVRALPPDLRWVEIYQGATFDCYAYDTAANSPAGYSNAVTATVGGFSLGSNSNYIFDNGCNPIPNPIVTINVTQAMAASNGFGFQWNAYSPKGAVCAYQQYCLIVNPSDGALYAMVDNWPAAANSPNLLNLFQKLYALPTAGLQVNDQLSMSLTTDANDNVIACTYAYNGQSTNIQLSTIAGFQQGYIAPITAFELDLVGPYNSESTVFSTGAGVITYASTSPLTPLTAEPTGCTETTAVTAETANSVYSTVLRTPSASISQSFQASVQAAIRRQGPLRRSTAIRIQGPLRTSTRPV